MRNVAMGDVTIARGFVKERLKEAYTTKTAVEEVKEAVKAKTNPWKREVSLGFDKRSGNTDSTELHSRFKFSRMTANREFKGRLDQYYSKFRRKMNGQRLSGQAYYAPYFDKERRLYNFYKFEADHDRFANVAYRYTPSTGLGYWFRQKGKFRLLCEMGAGFSYTNFRDDTPNRSEFILVPRIFVERTIWNRTRLSEDITVYPSLTVSGEFRIKSETILQTEITDRISLRFGVIDEYNSNPARGSRKNDFRVITALVYNF